MTEEKMTEKIKEKRYLMLFYKGCSNLIGIGTFDYDQYFWTYSRNTYGTFDVSVSKRNEGGTTFFYNVDVVIDKFEPVTEKN